MSDHTAPTTAPARPAAYRQPHAFVPHQPAATDAPHARRQRTGRRRTLLRRMFASPGPTLHGALLYRLWPSLLLATAIGFMVSR